jgi:hypothetical protein
LRGQRIEVGAVAAACRFPSAWPKRRDVDDGHGLAGRRDQVTSVLALPCCQVNLPFSDSFLPSRL